MKNKKESIVILEPTEITLIFVILLIITAALTTAGFILGKEYSKEEYLNKTKQEESLDIENLKKIVGLTSTNCYGVSMNNAIKELAVNGVSNATKEQIKKIYTVYINKNHIGTTVDNKYCNDDTKYNICHRTTESDLENFLKNYDFNYSSAELLNEWDNNQIDHTYFYNINENVNCISPFEHKVEWWYGMGNDKLSPSEYITLNDKTTIYYDETPTEEEYNYIFRKTNSNKKSNYYLIKIEKVDQN